MLASAAKSDNGLARELSSARAQLASQQQQIRELNHRIANSLQLAADMLVFEQLRSREPRAQAALEASRARLIAVAELHRYLYDHAERASVELRPFLTGLCQALFATTGLRCSVQSDQTCVPGDTAQQLAIAINEFAINAAKHAYDVAGGRLIITSRREGPELVLTVADEGKGLSAGPSAPGQGGLGMSIVAAIVRDLRGTLTVQSDQGARFTIRAPIGGAPLVDRSFQAWTPD
jgi:two-component sensor histidine kinase